MQEKVRGLTDFQLKQLEHDRTEGEKVCRTQRNMGRGEEKQNGGIKTVW